MKFNELHRRLEQAGWYIFKETDHRYYAHKDFPYLIKVGRHGSKEVPPNEFNKVLKKAGLISALPIQTPNNKTHDYEEESKSYYQQV